MQHFPNELPEKTIDTTSDSSSGKTIEPNYDSNRRGQESIQRDEIGTTGGARDRQPQQTMVPDSELER